MGSIHPFDYSFYADSNLPKRERRLVTVPLMTAVPKDGKGEMERQSRRNVCLTNLMNRPMKSTMKILATAVFMLSPLTLSWYTMVLGPADVNIDGKRANEISPCHPGETVRRAYRGGVSRKSSRKVAD